LSTRPTSPDGGKSIADVEEQQRLDGVDVAAAIARTDS
jgi:hypothetical protein